MKWRRFARWAKVAMLLGIALPVVGISYAFLSQETYQAHGSVQFQRPLAPDEIQQIVGLTQAEGVHFQIESNLVLVALQATSEAARETAGKIDAVIRKLPRRQLVAIEWGRAAAKPISPNRPLCVAVGFLLGMFFLAVGIVLAAFARDDRTRPPKLPC